MNISLKNVKIFPELSKDTNAFNASIYVDGKRIGNVRNNGNGGSHFYYWNDPAAGKRLEDWAATQKLEFDFDHLDQIIDQILVKSEYLRWLKRATKKKTLFRLPGDKKGNWREINIPFDSSIRTFLLRDHPTVECIANDDLDAATAFC